MDVLLLVEVRLGAEELGFEQRLDQRGHLVEYHVTAVTGGKAFLASDDAALGKIYDEIDLPLAAVPRAITTSP